MEKIYYLPIVKGIPDENVYISYRAVEIELYMKFVGFDIQMKKYHKRYRNKRSNTTIILNRKD